MRPSGAQWGISKFFVSNHSDAHYVFFFEFVSRTNNSNTKHVSTSLNKSQQERRVTTTAMLHHLQCMQPPGAQCFFVTNHYWRRPLTMFFFQIYSPANISNIYRPSQFEKVHSERFQRFFKPLLTQTWVVRGVNRSEKFERLLKYTFPGQPDCGGVQKTRKVNFYCKNQKYILIIYQV